MEDASKEEEEEEAAPEREHILLLQEEIVRAMLKIAEVSRKWRAHEWLIQSVCARVGSAVAHAGSDVGHGVWSRIEGHA